jgi:hypothetical protein
VQIKDSGKQQVLEQNSPGDCYDVNKCK